jgi:hypothetical protein
MKPAPEEAATAADPDALDAAPAVTEAAPVALEELVLTPAAALPPAAAIRTARVAGVTGRHAKIELRGMSAPIDAAIAPEVDPGVIADAVESGDTVLVETVPGAVPLIVGVLHTRRPRELKLRAGSIQIEGDEEVLLRSGRAAIRIRADGDIEVVGSRISASSRGLFRIVGRMLRLN